MDGAHSYVTTWPFVGNSFDKSFLPALIFLVAWDQALKTFPNPQSTTRFTLLEDLFYFVFPVSCLFSPTTEPGPRLDSFENQSSAQDPHPLRKDGWWGGGVGSLYPCSLCGMIMPILKTLLKCQVLASNFSAYSFVAFGKKISEFQMLTLQGSVAPGA